MGRGVARKCGLFTLLLIMAWSNNSPGKEDVASYFRMALSFLTGLLSPREEGDLNLSVSDFAAPLGLTSLL